MRQHVIEHAPEGVFGVVGHRGAFDGLGDSDAQAARRIGVLGQYFAAGLGVVGRAGVHFGAPGVHQHLAVGLLLKADLHHVYLAFEAEELTGKTQRATPLAGAGFGGNTFYTLLLIVVGLRYGGVRFVRSGRADAFVFVVDFGGGVQRFFQPVGAVQRCGAPYRVDVAHLVGNLNPFFGRYFLHDERHGKQGRQRFGPDGLQGARVQRRQGLVGHVGHDVVPVARDFLFGEEDFALFHVKKVVNG